MIEVTPINLEQANAFVSLHHRHHKPVLGAKFALAVADDAGVVRGVAIVGRPVARHLDDGWTLEVNRCCTDGARNACSMLYGAAWKAAKALGFRRIVTYTLPEEGRQLARDWMATDVQCGRHAVEQQHPQARRERTQRQQGEDAMGGRARGAARGPATSASARAGAWASGV